MAQTKAQKKNNIFQKFFSNKKGNIATIFAVMAIPILGSTGVAVDYLRITELKSELQDSIDAAILAGARTAQDEMLKGSSRRAIQRAAFKTAREYHAANYVVPPNHSKTSREWFLPLYQINDGKIAGNAYVFGSFDTSLSRVLGIKRIAYKLNSSVALAASQNVDLHIVLDTSNSMGIGATTAVQRIMDTSMGCAFACHVPDEPYQGNPEYTYTEHENTLDDARALGVQLRIDAAKDSIKQIIDRVQGSNVRVALHTFSNDITTVSGPTDDFSSLKSKLDDVTLSNEWNTGGTNFDYSLENLGREIGHSGNGRSSSDAKKVVVLITDGVATNFRYIIRETVPGYQPPPEPEPIFTFGGSNLTLTSTGRDEGTKQSDLDPNMRKFNPEIQWGESTDFANVQGFNPRACNKLKNVYGMEVYTLNLDYVIPGPGPSLSHDTRFRSIDRTLKPLIPDNMAACASSPEKAAKANNPDEITDALNSIVESALGSKNLIFTR